MVGWVSKPSDRQARHAAVVNELLRTVDALECAVQLLSEIRLGDAVLRAILRVTAVQIERCQRSLTRLLE